MTKDCGTFSRAAPGAPDPAEAEAARALFPRGLFQPPGSFRFSAEALLLAAFAAPLSGDRVLDLGTGCGVVALALLCRVPGLAAVGIDIQPALVAAARENARRLGLALTALHGNAGDADLFARPGQGGPAGTGRTLEAASFDHVLANPPYRRRHAGRLPESRARLEALFERPETLGAFCRAAATALRPGGRFTLVYPLDRLPELHRTMADQGLHLARLLRLRPRRGAEPVHCLAEAVKDPGPDPPRPAEILADLVLHQGEGAAATFSEQALAFCPWLGRPARQA